MRQVHFTHLAHPFVLTRENEMRFLRLCGSIGLFVSVV
jgi:hypothetical protein